MSRLQRHEARARHRAAFRPMPARERAQAGTRNSSCRARGAHDTRAPPRCTSSTAAKRPRAPRAPMLRSARVFGGAAATTRRCCATTSRVARSNNATRDATRRRTHGAASFASRMEREQLSVSADRVVASAFFVEQTCERQERVAVAGVCLHPPLQLRDRQPALSILHELVRAILNGISRRPAPIAVVTKLGNRVLGAKLSRQTWSASAYRA